MTPEDVMEHFLFVGRNRRSSGERTEMGRLVIGCKGIGKLAGFGIASKIEINTWKDGFNANFNIDRQSFEDLYTLEDKDIEINCDKSNHESGTSIKLHGLHEDLRLPPSDVLRRHLFSSLPSATTFVIKVNGTECTAEDIHGQRHNFSERVEDVGQVTGYYILANARQKKPGLAVRVRGRIAQEPGLFGLDTRAHGFFTAEKIVGEINAEFLDPETVDGERRELINTARSGFLEDSPIVQKLNNWSYEFIKTIVQGELASAKFSLKRPS